MPRPIDAFIAHHRADDRLLHELERHLVPLKKKGLLDWWHQALTTAGDDVQEKVIARLQEAELIILLLTSDFLANDASEQLVDLALARRQAEGTPVFPILARECSWEMTALHGAGLEPLPPNCRPITSAAWGTADEAWTAVVRALLDLILPLMEARGGGSRPERRHDELPASLRSDEVVRRMTAGMRSLATDYAWRVQHFLEEYLGRPGEPVPFGGRDDALRSLDAWLAEGREPFALMAAPAGQGKSALLARWSARLVARRDIAVAFIPVSVRFETNLANVALATLAAQLAALHGEQIPGTSNVPIDELRGVVTRYLERGPSRGRRVVVILDGLDEAAGFQVANLFPRVPPDGLRILVSARLRSGEVDETAWLRELGWQGPRAARLFPLEPLTLQGISDVLIRMGVPLDALGDSVEFVSALYRATEGDPLLVWLYVRRFQERGEGARLLTPADLRAIEPGFKGYIDLWWRDQNTLWGGKSATLQPAVRALLNVLACALGPLSRDDVAELLEEDDVSSWDLDDALRSLSRLVLGDGRHVGYVFSHPKIAVYFHDQLHAPEREALERRFLSYGERTLAALTAGTLKPSAASAYVVQRYGEHLERARSGPEAFLPLATEPWKKAWEVVEGSYAGFLSDVARAFAAASRVNQAYVDEGRTPPLLHVEVHYALCRASVNSLAHNIDPVLVTALVRFGLWTPVQGLTFVRQIHDAERRAAAIALVAPHLPHRLRRVAVEDLLSMPALGSEAYAQSLIALAPDIPDVLIPLVLEAALRLDSPWSRARVIQALAPRIPEKQVPSALRAARDMGDPLPCAQALASLIPRVPDAMKRDLVDEVLAKLDTDACTDMHGRILASMVPNVPEAALGPLLAASRKAKLPEARARALDAISRRLSDPGRRAVVEEAFKAAKQVMHRGVRAELLSSLTTLLSETERVAAESTSLLAAESIADLSARAAAVARHPSVTTRRLRELVGMLSVEQLVGLRVLARLAEQLEPEELHRVWEDVVLQIESILTDDADKASRLIVSLAPVLPQSELPDMLCLAKTLGDKALEARAVTALAARLDPVQRDAELNAALSASQAIEDQGSILMAALRVVPHLDASREDERPRDDLFRIIMSLRRTTWMGLKLVLAEILPSLQGRSREEAIRVLRYDGSLVPEMDLDTSDLEAGELPYEYDVIIAIAPYLQREQLAVVLDALEESQDVQRRAHILVSLAPQLDPDLRDSALIDFIEVALHTDDIEPIDLIEAIGPWLPLTVVPHVYSIVAQVREPSERVRALTALLSGPLASGRNATLGDALAAAADYLSISADKILPVGRASVWRVFKLALRRLNSGSTSSDEELMSVLALVELTPHLPEQRLRAEILQRMLYIALDVDDHAACAEVLSKLAAQLPEKERMPALEQAMAALEHVGDQNKQLELTRLVAPYVREAVLATALDCVSHVAAPGRVVGALVRLLPCLQGTARDRALADALAAARRIDSAAGRAQALTALVPWLAEPARDSVMMEALLAARASGWRDCYAEVYTTLAPVLPSTELDEALRLAGELGGSLRFFSSDDSLTAERLLKALAPRLSASQVERAVAFALDSPLHWRRLPLLSCLPLERLSPPVLYRIIHDLLLEVGGGARDRALPWLKMLYPALAALGGADTMVKVARSLLDVARWWP
ncbi:hypothetical protein [Sorangium sp. So ce406]|uniref:hypothetical protein n=1 Tax=Sorangium sp. So ce406 TaxID=3133311 RepID=UPI003F5B1526